MDIGTPGLIAIAVLAVLMFALGRTSREGTALGRLVRKVRRPARRPR